MTVTSSAHGSKYANEINQAIESESESLRQLSLQIHSNPELGYKEVFAHKVLTDYLESKGFNVTRHAYEIDTAFIAEYESPAATAAAAAGEKVKAVGYCSEYDALPGIGHACGHNLIAISGVAAALGVKAVLEKHNLAGRVRLVGTPAEETTGGKIPLIKSGAFDGLEACMMAHPAPADVVYCTVLSVGGVAVEYFGKASHASASPWEGVNALDALVTAYNGIGLLRQQTAPTSRVHGIITNGGQAPNIIPDYAAGKFLYRATNIDDHRKIRDSVMKILNAAADSTGCTVKITEEMEYKPVPNNELLAARYAAYTEDLGVKYVPRAIQEAAPSGSTDMGNVAHYLPGIHPVFNIASLEGAIDTEVSNHSIRFTEQAKTEVAHAATLRSAKGLAMTGVDVVLEPGFSEAAWDDFEKRVPKEGVDSVEEKLKTLASVSTGGCGCH
ncbi:hypothetical protein BC939DRAFT_449979 [Gamsiella multidivaricata]|uniref:uncharacterized protein n=1 Tax=Gamsiella multidivaricata TaxID=101098 RepID=UPI0022204B8D|nr:uncharacterized protein BC939DRAFT_449979 [Gamsiella multidivaricata]KAG0356341.1 hypothetical protein BGZ54_000764 [Gamsiella multidivaricata]KAI7824307.1 hypothetical protein BC939DRAFT_449979 [Gamsiella multidivaricata]